MSLGKPRMVELQEIELFFRPWKSLPVAEVIRCWWTLARKRAFQPRNGPPLSLYAQPLGGRMVRKKTTCP